MKKRLKKILFMILHPVATKVGYVSKKHATKNTLHTKSDLLSTFYKNLQNQNFKPNHILDIGANHGTWTRYCLDFFPSSQYTMVEPQSWLSKSSEDLQKLPNVAFFPLGMGQEEGVFKFTIVDRDDSCSFRYTEAEAKAQGFEQVEIPVKTINTFLLENNLSIPDIVKIDAEGLDLQVLKGATNIFGITELFLVEVGVVNKNIENNLRDVVNFMNDKGYTLFDITDMNRPYKSNALWLLELAFVKKDGFFSTVDFQS